MIRLGLIGAGGYGRHHIDSFLGLQNEGLVNIAAVADSSSAILDDVRHIEGLRAARFFGNYRDLLSDADVDAVVISAPIPLHFEMTLGALERNLFVLLEKPPAPLVSQLEELIAADVDGRVMVAYQKIYSDVISRLKRELVAGSLGALQSISAFGLWPRPASYYRRSGWAGQLEWRGLPVFDGPCTNGMAHFVDLALYLAGDEPEAYALPASVSGEVYRARPDISSYDTACLAGQFERGVKFFLGFSHASAVNVPVEMCVRGAKGSVQLMRDCRALRYDGGDTVEGDDGCENLRRAFLAFAQGDAAQNRTPLPAMRSYVLTTNLMRQSSGGIHPIPPEYVRQIITEEHGTLFDVQDLLASFQRCAAELIPLGDTGLSWARKGAAREARNELPAKHAKHAKGEREIRF